MTVTPEQFREEAQKARIDEAEAERRTAVSRSYYAAYHKCRPLAQQEGIFADVKGSHAKVIEALRRSRERKVKGIGYRLDQCRELRVKADISHRRRLHDLGSQAGQGSMRQNMGGDRKARA